VWHVFWWAWTALACKHLHNGSRGGVWQNHCRGLRGRGLDGQADIAPGACHAALFPETVPAHARRADAWPPEWWSQIDDGCFMAADNRKLIAGCNRFARRTPDIAAHGWLRLSNWTRQGAIRPAQSRQFIVFIRTEQDNTYIMQILRATDVLLPYVAECLQFICVTDIHSVSTVEVIYTVFQKTCDHVFDDKLK